ncbi:GGDEF domain-containing protein [Metabacillus sp. RGM 3146]|uniref:GGDEF domain-containing protein n=1 Tax=Metabacillus sp. RGM 3146 TaxID=3401092 RepID=UPI003B9BA84A
MEKYDKQIDLPVSIIVLDLDELKKWNDTLGHAKGDALIKQTAAILNSFASDRLTISRIGGDEFVLIGEAFTEKDTEGLIRNIFERLEASNQENGTNLCLSVGSAASLRSIGCMDSLFREADKKMYTHKNSKK